MTARTSLLGGAALTALLVLALAPTAEAAKGHHRRAKVDPNAGLRSEVADLKAQVQALNAWKDQETADRAQTQQQVQQLQGQLADANARADRAQAEVQSQIQTIPGAIDQAVAAAKPKTDKIYYKGITLTLGGFAAAEGVYRSRNNVADIGSNYAKIPYLNSVMAHTDELRFTARQSRISFLAQGDINKETQASFYGEFDFLAGPTTANSNESNSFSPRIRNVYGALDWNYEGWHLLAGQNWSLATMNQKGITPRNELPPATIDAQYVVGFVWARQPQLRLVKDLDDKQVWLALSIENPQTTFGSAATGSSLAYSGVTATTALPGISQLSSVNNFSLNHVPDVIAKVAFEPILEGGVQPLHIEAFGIYRQFYDRVNIAAGANQATAVGLTPGNFTENTDGWGVGGGVTWAAVPKILDLQASGIVGHGIGRYGAGQLPDVVVSPRGSLTALPEWMFLAGATLHATPALDIYVYGGEETGSARQSSPTITVAGKNSVVLLGYGNPNATLGNCFIEGAACSPDTRQISQIAVGLWDKAYTGSFGQVRVGLQYSHTDLRAFPGVFGANALGIAPGLVVRPSTSDDMVFTSFRYYPF
jgi:hypothetical protein